MWRCVWCSVRRNMWPPVPAPSSKGVYGLPQWCWQHWGGLRWSRGGGWWHGHPNMCWCACSCMICKEPCWPRKWAEPFPVVQAGIMARPCLWGSADKHIPWQGVGQLCTVSSRLLTTGLLMQKEELLQSQLPWCSQAEVALCSVFLNVLLALAGGLMGGKYPGKACQCLSHDTSTWRSFLLSYVHTSRPIFRKQIRGGFVMILRRKPET